MSEGLLDPDDEGRGYSAISESLGSTHSTGAQEGCWHPFLCRLPEAEL